ncbi:MAG TPA: TonB-dependent receptor [Allosphingosinicella sp.]|jgi:TonB-dependent receptor|uniref:TonB-dependent receptor n=1 Tax=Allosphingosinicella sp. TaxID=2823234 RepID=UPI002F27A7E7
MRLKSLILCSASAGVLALGAAPAWAQQPSAAQPPATQSPEGQEAQEQPADPEAGAPQADDAVQSEAGADDASAGEDIVVTGFRESLRSARNLKRNSEQIVDAIVAEDIGKLPDLAVSDTAARIPGVTVDRFGGEASRVLVRGLPDYTTTYNGREIFTAETRQVALQDFPSANIAALEVFKTTTANLVEAGLAGLVNVRSRRPFDFKGFELGGSVWGLYTKQAGEITPNGNILVSNRWDTGIGEIGVLVNASYTRLKFLDSEPSNTDFLQTFGRNGNQLNCCGPADVRFPDVQRLFYREGDRTRPSVNASIQWRPNDTLEFYAEGLYQGFRNKVSDRRLDALLFGGQSYTNLVFRGDNTLSSGTVTNPPALFSFQGGTFNKTDTYQFAVGGRYEAGPFTLTADLARTDSRFTGSTESVDRRYCPNGSTIDFDLETPQFTVSNCDLNDPANQFFEGLFEEDQVSEGDDYQARIDAQYEFGDESFLRSVQVGARLTDRDAHREFGDRFAGFNLDRRIPITALPLDFAVPRRGFRGTDIQSGTETFLTPTYRSIRRNREELRQFVIANNPNFGFPNNGRAFTVEPVAPNPTATFDAQEKTYAGYAQVNFGFGERLEGIAGIRAVHTEVGVSGTANVNGVFTPIDAEQSFTDFLPNASLRFRITPQLQLRASYTQTRTRPTFAQLNPSATLGAPDPTQGGLRTGSAGNPFLRPLDSDNYDLSLEYYFSPTGFMSAAVFRRDLRGFIQNETVTRDDPTLGPIRVTTPVNTRSGRIQGLEAQLSTFFDFEGIPDFLGNFGIQANYTYLDGRLEIADPLNAGEFITDQIQLPGAGGVSKHTYNLVGMYEGGPFSARLTYNHRSSYLDRRDIRGDEEGGFYREFANPPGRLDLSTNFTIIENATIFFDWTNILEDPFRQNFSSARAGQPRAQYVRFLRFEESTMSLGVRFRL